MSRCDECGAEFDPICRYCAETRLAEVVARHNGDMMVVVEDRRALAARLGEVSKTWERLLETSAAVEKERDELEAELQGARAAICSLVTRENALAARVARLEAAMEPPPYLRRKYLAELMANAKFDGFDDAIGAMDGLLHAIRAAAGLGSKEG